MPISDILACSEPDLPNIMAAENPWGHGTWFSAKNIGMIELSQLGEMLHVGTYDELSEQFNLIGEPKPDGPWPESTPPNLMTKLATLSELEINEVSVRWSEIEEFHGASKPEELASYLKTLRDFLQSNDGPYYLVNAL